jgi:hypothetical protein
MVMLYLFNIRYLVYIFVLAFIRSPIYTTTIHNYIPRIIYDDDNYYGKS